MARTKAQAKPVPVVGTATVHVKGDVDPNVTQGRPFSCPKCGAEYFVEQGEGAHGGTLHFDFACEAAGCGYKAVVGLA